MKYLKSTAIYILVIMSAFLGFILLACVYLISCDFELVDFIDSCLVNEDEKP